MLVRSTTVSFVISDLYGRQNGQNASIAGFFFDNALRGRITPATTADRRHEYGPSTRYRLANWNFCGAAIP